MAVCWMRSPHRLANERGIALAVILLILVIILLLGTTLVGVSVTENLASSGVAEMKKAFAAAETGIQEAMYRMRLDPATLPNEGDTGCSATADPVVTGYVLGQGGAITIPSPDPTNLNFWAYNPPACSWTYSGSSAAGYGNYWGGTAANLDSAGRTFASSGSSHAAGGELVNASLTNTASDPRTYTVTVAPVVGFVGGCWQYVDQLGTLMKPCPFDPINPPNPMFKVTATGTAKSSQKVLSAMIRRFGVSPTLDGALTANSNVNVQSASGVIDGHNFDCNGNNPSDSGSVKAATTPSGVSGITVNKAQNLQCTAGTGVTKCGGTSSPFPSSLGALLLGPTAKSTEIAILDAYLESIKIAPGSAPTSAFAGILYINGNYQQPPDGSKGLLIVHNGSNNANLGNFNVGTFKGVIIADQINQINGNAQIIGGILALGSAGTVALDDISGTPSIKYSKCQIDNLVKYFPYEIVRGTWHEK